MPAVLLCTNILNFIARKLGYTICFTLLCGIANEKKQFIHFTILFTMAYTNTTEIPVIEFTKNQYNKTTKEIILDLNDYKWLDELLKEHQKNNRRILPHLRMKSPSGTIVCFAYPHMDKWEIVYTGKKCNLRLGY